MQDLSARAASFDSPSLPGVSSEADLARVRMLSLIVEQVGVGVAVVDNDANFVYANPTFAAMHGCTVDQLQSDGYKGSIFYDPAEWSGRVQSLMRDTLSNGVGRCEITRRRLDGSTFAADVTLSLLRNTEGTLVGRVLIVADISERHQAEERLRVANARLRELATTDALTGLPNRTLFADRLEQTVAQAHREGRTVSLLFLDLDRFKNVNDSLGNNCGDDVLVEVSRRLLAAVREGDTVARLGGDEFAVLLSGATAPKRAAADAERVLSCIRPTIVSEGAEFFVTASVGVAIWPGDSASAPQLLQQATAAMYRAKAAGGDRFEMFDTSMAVAIRERLNFESDLRRAVDASQFFLRYHPQIDLLTGEIVAVEALVRWEHPARGEVMPGEFISVAEDTALIIPIGAWVLAEACRQAALWRCQLKGRPALRMAVNVSPRQLADPGFVALVRQALADTATPACDLELEITESTLISDTGPAVATLETLRLLGIGIAIDDFGTGYSSLSYLRRFPVDRLKLDMSFIAGLGMNHRSADHGDAALVAAAINLAHALGLEAVAEGVENAEQLETLVAFGCDQGQGYLWTEPLCAEDFELWLAQPALTAIRMAVDGSVRDRSETTWTAASPTAFSHG